MNGRRVRFLLLYYSILFLAGFAFVSLALGEPALPPEKEVPLVLNAKGYVTKFLVGWWQMGAQELDVNGDGIMDYAIFFGTRGGLSVGIVHDYGIYPNGFGPAVFYSVKDGAGKIVEWAGDPSWMSHPPKRS